jgi:transposase
MATVDATGLEVRHVSTHYRIRRVQGDTRRTHQSRRWPKVTAVAHTHSHLILGVALGEGPTNDAPDFAPALRQAAALLPLDTVLADAAYDTEAHHRLCHEDFGIPHVVIALNPRGSGRRWPRTPCRRALRRAFPKTLYRQRWHAESVFSRHKRRLGSALREHTPTSRAQEITLRFLTHNLMILCWCLAKGFNRACSPL